MDFLAPPPKVSLEMSEAVLPGEEDGVDGVEREDEISWGGSDGGSNDSSDERPPRSRGLSNDGRGASLNPFASGTGEPSPAGEAVAGAALASDYGAWLKRLAVRLRRGAPAGDRFVRLRRISPVVTGDEVGCNRGLVKVCCGEGADGGIAAE